jgi:flagellin
LEIVMQTINTNVASLFGQVALNRSAQALLTAQQRLSSGLRINSAKDDATGLITASNFDMEVRATAQLARNVNDAISLAQTADGYLSQIQDNTVRLSEIYNQTGAVTNSEATALIAENTRLSGLVKASTSAKVDTGTGTAGGAGTTFASATSFASYGAFTTEIGNITADRAKFGADIAGLSSALNALQVEHVNASASYSRVMDTDYAVETTAATKNQILQQAGMASLAQSNQNPSMVLTLLK